MSSLLCFFSFIFHTQHTEKFPSPSWSDIEKSEINQTMNTTHPLGWFGHDLVTTLYERSSRPNFAVSAFSANNLAENPKKLASTWGLGDFLDVCNNPESAYSVPTLGQSLPLNQILTNVKSGYFFSANFFGINPLTIWLTNGVTRISCYFPTQVDMIIYKR